MLRKLGALALSILLILAGLTKFGIAFPNEDTVLALFAIITGILILLGR